MSYGDHRSEGSPVKGRNNATTTASTSLVAAPGPAQKLWISSCSVYNRSSQGTCVHLMSAGTIIWTFACPPNDGGSNMPFPNPIDCAVNEACNFKTEDNADVDVSVAGYRAPE